MQIKFESLLDISYIVKITYYCYNKNILFNQLQYLNIFKDIIH